jgi:copper chaperone NosL
MMERIIMLAVMLILVTACQTTPDFERPPEIRYGEDICERCGMIISEPRFAAAYVTRQGTGKIFDDIGDLLIHSDESGDDVAVYWVHDFENERWVKATEAYFVASQDLTTPMGHGIVAFSDFERASAWAAKNSTRTLRFGEVQAADFVREIANREDSISHISKH